MARGARIVNDYSRYQDIEEMYISYNGEVKQIGEAYVSYQGVIKQWWPPEGLTNDSLAYDGVDRVSASFNTPAIFQYEAQTGKVTLSATQGTTNYNVDFEAINPPPRALGQYLFKLEQLSGDALTSDFTLGAWIDVLSNGSVGFFNASLDVVGTAQARFSVSADDGAGNPTGTPVEGLIDFINSESQGDIIMTTEPWDLHNTEVNELAEVYVLTVPDGWYDPYLGYNVPEAFITGEFGQPQGYQIGEIYVDPWSNAIQVKADVISGTLAAGSEPTGTFLSTSVRRRWWIEANPGEDVTAEIDITIQDSLTFDSVTKRVNMRATSTLEQADSSLSDEFTRRDSILDWQTTPNPPFNDATIEFRVQPDGMLDCVTYNTNNGNSFQGFPQKWNESATSVPDPENFECRITWLSGWRKFYYRDRDQTISWVIVATAGASRRDSSPWQNLNEMREFRFTHSDSTGSTDRLWNYEGQAQIEIREVGRPETVKIKIVDCQLLIQT